MRCAAAEASRHQEACLPGKMPHARSRLDRPNRPPHGQPLPSATPRWRMNRSSRIHALVRCSSFQEPLRKRKQFCRIGSDQWGTPPRQCAPCAPPYPPARITACGQAKGIALTAARGRSSSQPGSRSGRRACRARTRDSGPTAAGRGSTGRRGHRRPKAARAGRARSCRGGGSEKSDGPHRRTFAVD